MVDFCLDRLNKTGDLTGTWTFTQGSPNVNAPGADGNAVAELAVNDYVKPTATNEWYRVLSVTDDDNFVLAYNFVQATQVDVVTNYADVSVNDGTSAAKAFVHVNQYTTDAVRSAGDTLHLRRGQTHLIQAVQVTSDETSSTTYISVIADDGTWWVGEGGLAAPIFDFGSALFRWIAARSNWWYEGFEIRNSAFSHAMLVQAITYFIDITFRGNVIGIELSTVSFFVIDGCVFVDNSSIGISAGTGSINGIIRNCVLDGTGAIGINLSASGIVTIENCVSGGTTPFTTGDIRIQNFGGSVYLINCKLSSATPISELSWRIGGRLYVVDRDDTKDYHLLYYEGAWAAKETGTTRVGGATTSIKATPSTYSDDNPLYPFIPFETWIYNAGEAKTYTIYMLAGGGWTALPNSSEVYIEAQYYDAGGDAGRAEVVSNDAFADEVNWKAYDVTCTPAAAGMVRLRVYCKKYEAGKLFYIDPLPVVS